MASLGRWLFLLLALPLGGFLRGEEAAFLTVKRVVDGDTLVLSNNEKVRLIGVDTPEYHPTAKQRRDAQRSRKDVRTIKAQGAQASVFTKGLVDGRRVKLEYDNGNAATHHRDRYGRLLAYVYFMEAHEDDFSDSITADIRALSTYREGFLNGLLIEAGYGHALTRYPFKHKDRFLKYERDARRTGRGLWKE